jgi:7,8-dihydropterin-6-yl-methyl-4-(beta-D-ribofuranosyl)aminobenzene 5'-phosphate synthase
MKWTQKLFLLVGALFGGALLTSYICPPSSRAEAAKAEAQAVTQNRITVLYDAFGKPSSMKKDWGFSALVEVSGKRILFDTGNNSEIFAHNVKAKGVDLTKLDFVVMSHRHGDHIGGLNHLLSVNPNVPIYAPKENFGVFGSSFPGSFYRRNESLPPEMRYFDGKPPETLRFGTAWPQGKFTWVAKTTEVAPGFHLILLKGPWGVDLDVMEISLAIDTPQGIVIVVGCSHPTIEKIVEAAKAAINKPIHLVVGGLHLLPATDQETQRIATALHDTWKVEWIAPGHCTGEPAFATLKETFGDHYLYAGLGTTVALGAKTVAGADGEVSLTCFDKDDLQTYGELARLSPDAAASSLSTQAVAMRSTKPDCAGEGVAVRPGASSDVGKNGASPELMH